MTTGGADMVGTAGYSAIRIIILKGDLGRIDGLAQIGEQDAVNRSLTSNQY